MASHPIAVAKSLTPPILTTTTNDPLHQPYNTRHLHFSYRRPKFTTSASLIKPDGGRLVNLVVSNEQQPSRVTKLLDEAVALVQIKLSNIDLEWVHVLSQGWASPLTGFMNESQFLQTLHFNSLRVSDGSVVNMSVPIVLAIDDVVKDLIVESGYNRVALLHPISRNPIAILNK